MTATAAAGDSPGIVVPLVDAQGRSEAAHGLVQLLGLHVLMAEQRVGVGKPRVHLETQSWLTNICILMTSKIESVKI